MSAGDQWKRKFMFCLNGDHYVTDVFNEELSKVVPYIEQDLRKNKNMTIDTKAEKAIRAGAISCKVYDHENAIAPLLQPSNSKLNKKYHEWYMDEWVKNYTYTDTQKYKDIPSKLRPVLIGSEAVNLSHQDEYI